MSNNAYRRENSLVQSIVMFVIFFAMFIGGIFAFSFWSLESFASAFVPGVVGLGLCTLGVMIPLLIGRSDSAGE